MSVTICQTEKLNDINDVTIGTMSPYDVPIPREYSMHYIRYMPLLLLLPLTSLYIYMMTYDDMVTMVARVG